ERSDVFGLAQLYQIRGRVGRSRERAYAYLLYPAHAALTEDAMKRLSALSDYTELGAGFKIAMRDLEIRGAGNLLGDEHSGHVALLRDELEDRFGPVPDPLANLIALQQARIKLGQAGARVVSFRGGRLAVTPIELDDEQAARLKTDLPQALYEPGRSQVSVRVPEDPHERFPAVVKAADTLLAVVSGGASEPLSSPVP